MFLAAVLAVTPVMTLSAEPAPTPGLPPARLERAPLHFGLTTSAFRGVNANDAGVALQLLAQTIGKQRGYAIDTSTRVFEDTKSCEAAINRGGLSLVILNAQEYLSMDVPGLKPAFVHLEQGVVLKDYLLLTRRDSGYESLADLRGRDIVLLSGGEGRLTTTWLEVLLREDGLGPSGAFFQRILSESNPALTVLPVFFGTKSACIVDRMSFKTMVELNPQVGRQLRPIAISDPYIDSITCIPLQIETTPQARLDLIRTLNDLHQTVAGRQILTLFKVDQLVPFQDQYLDAARRLRAKAIRFGILPLAQTAAASVPP